MRLPRPRLALAVTAAAMLACWPAAARRAGAELVLGEDGRLALSADFRARLEQDFDSLRADGRARDDRLRLRVRARFGFTWKASDSITLATRLRSGSKNNHQSPHVTLLDFDGNDTGAADFDLDKWYVRRETGASWAWIGRNSLPFWRQNDFFWDDDVTPAGVAGSWRPGEPGNVELRWAYLTLPVGMNEFSGNLGGVQALYRRRTLTLAAGLFDFDAARDDPQAPILRNGNGLRDYRIAVVNLQRNLEAGGRPLVFGLDLMRNDRGYEASDPFAFANRKETDAWVGSIAWGQTRARGDWLLAAVVAHVEALAVNSSYAGDDWIRWGSPAETEASDLEGLELRYARGLGDGSDLVARLFLVEAITSRQDGNRLRLDYNLRF